MRLPSIMILLLLLIPGSLPAQSIEKPELEQLVEEANTFFREAMNTANKDPQMAKKLYEKAAVYYEKIVTDGNIKNGRLFYNTGNAYFRSGDIGRAILNYLKARQYIPDDKNLLQNLEYARSKRQDTVQEKEADMLLQTVFFWHYDIPPVMRLIIFAVFFVLTWILAILKLFFKQGILNFFLIITVVVTVLFSGSLLVEFFGKSGEKPGVVLATEVTARKGDSNTYEKSFQEPLHAGTEFLLLEERRGWYNIELKDGRSCWIPARDAGLVK